MKHFFSHTEFRKTTTLEENKINGKAAERYISSLLTVALNARVNFTSRTEDDAKIDLVTIISHPWINNEVSILPTQVKSGTSYAKQVDGKRLELKKGKYKNLMHRNEWLLVCWAKMENTEAYWFLIKPNSKFIKLDYNTNHLITPLTKFHLIRIINSVSTRDGGRGLVFIGRTSYSKLNREDYIKLRTIAKKKYADYKNKNIINPVFGKIEITRLGWRHITRFGRWYPFKIASFEIIKIADKILQVSPTTHYTLKNIMTESDEYIYYENEYLLRYDKIKVRDLIKDEIQNTQVFIKLLEVLSYPKDWSSSPEKNNKFSRRIIFKSIYYK